MVAYRNLEPSGGLRLAVSCLGSLNPIIPKPLEALLELQVRKKGDIRTVWQALAQVLSHSRFGIWGLRLVWESLCDLGSSPKMVYVIPSYKL